ncbi:hypothetical protein [Staphylococcus sp. GDX8P102P-2]|uniref:hypothetical protein n=1 Tax=Staphylococcus sp. GDX8P102P-2 TaxID=2804106 RepID=UPI001AEC2B9A|nr:hypothetical protein [Staphylococcus sp. GDX8P102P-2]
MWALILLVVGLIGFKYMDSNGKAKISNAYSEQISKDEEQLQSDFDIDEINNIATTGDNKDKLIFESGLIAVINDENFKFVDHESEERIEFERPTGVDMRLMFSKENEKLRGGKILRAIQQEDFYVQKQIREYVITQGLKVYMTKDRYSELKKVNITFAKDE